jgi:hypothetical protein
LVVRCVLALFFALAIGHLAFDQTASAQEPRDPLIDPPSGSVGSRFQIVGQAGWVPGETVTLHVYFTTSTDPLNVAPSAAPLSREFSVTVLADGTWSFPIVVNEFFAADGGAPPPDMPGYIGVRATAGSHTGANAFVYTVRSVLPIGAEGFAEAGVGPPGPMPGATVVVALFAGGLGLLLALSGALRRGAASA